MNARKKKEKKKVDEQIDLSIFFMPLQHLTREKNEKDHKSRKLFFSAKLPEKLQIC